MYMHIYTNFFFLIQTTYIKINHSRTSLLPRVLQANSYKHHLLVRWSVCASGILEERHRGR